jgi:hypothetical protein
MIKHSPTDLNLLLHNESSRRLCTSGIRTIRQDLLDFFYNNYAALLLNLDHIYMGLFIFSSLMTARVVCTIMRCSASLDRVATDFNDTAGYFARRSVGSAHILEY